MARSLEESCASNSPNKENLIGREPQAGCQREPCISYFLPVKTASYPPVFIVKQSHPSHTVKPRLSEPNYSHLGRSKSNGRVFTFTKDDSGIPGDSLVGSWRLWKRSVSRGLSRGGHWPAWRLVR